MSATAIAGGRVAYAKPVTQNRKLGDVAATYVSQATCPSTCPFLGAGCYAETGHIGIYMARPMAEASAGVDPCAVTLEEVHQIDALPATRDLRLHVLGDVHCESCARELAAAVDRYRARARRPVRVWTYTHNHQVSREAFGAISVLRSCETAAQRDAAFAAGFGVAQVWPDRLPADGRAFRDGDVTVIPCPYETRGVSCVDCGLCLDAAALARRRAVIAFTPHSKGAARVQATVRRLAAIPRLREEPMTIETPDIALDLIDPSPANPRTRFDPAKLHELATSVAQHGVLEPLLVRANGERYQLIAGERRLRAARMVGLTEAPCRVLEVSDAEASLMAIAENLMRADLDAVDEAEAFARLQEQHGMTQAEIAAKVGRSAGAISLRMSLLRLPADIQEHVRAGLITPSHGEALALHVGNPVLLHDLTGRALRREVTVKEIREASWPGVVIEPRRRRDRGPTPLESKYARDAEQDFAAYERDAAAARVLERDAIVEYVRGQARDQPTRDKREALFSIARAIENNAYRPTAASVPA